MCKVRIGKRIFDAKVGERLGDLLQRYGIEAPHPCAGRGVCQKCRAFVDGEEILTCQYIIEGDITVVLPERGGLDVTVLATDGDFSTEGLFYALDIGTTTLCLSLAEKDGKELGRVNAQNPQIVFGADVISRIEQCTRDGATSLQLPLVNRINEMTAALKNALGMPDLRVACMYAAGNTTMLHLLLGVDCTSIGVAPYTPKFLEEREVSASETGVLGCDRLCLLPSAHSFVGADVVAGLGLIDAPDRGKYSLFVDLGTNAEIALISKDKILCTAAAAGPCFEGSNIRCGMSALTGAVCSVSLTRDGIKVETIGGGEPRGLCATGLIDSIFWLLQTEDIEDSGYMEEDYYLADKVYLSPADVRNFQLAKSAVHSAMEALLSLAGIGFDDVDALYLSGGFAKKLSVFRAAYTGLIPKALAGRCRILEDSCLRGIIRYACGEAELSALACASEYCDLSADEVFGEKFIENMSFDI